MNAATQLSLAAMSASAAGAATQVRLDHERTEDLYAVWKSVFERARAVEVSRDAAYSRVADWQDFQVSDQDGEASMGRASGSHDGARLPAVLRPRPPTIGQIGAAPLAANAWSNDITNAARDPFAAATSPVTVQREVDDTVAVRPQIPKSLAAPQSVSNAASRHAVTVTQPAPAELVNVFVQGAAITVVVRDAKLSTEEALHCAFATARELIGERAALYQLTLNGRTVYQRSDLGANGPAHGIEQPESLLVFAC